MNNVIFVNWFTFLNKIWLRFIELMNVLCWRKMDFFILFRPFPLFLQRAANFAHFLSCCRLLLEAKWMKTGINLRKLKWSNPNFNQNLDDDDTNFYPEDYYPNPGKKNKIEPRRFEMLFICLMKCLNVPTHFQNGFSRPCWPIFLCAWKRMDDASWFGLIIGIGLLHECKHNLGGVCLNVELGHKNYFCKENFCLKSICE